MPKVAAARCAALSSARQSSAGAFNASRVSSIRAPQFKFDMENVCSVLSNKHSVNVHMPRRPDSDADYLEKLQDYYAQNQVLPSYAAIGKLIGLKSTSSVSAFLTRLKAARYI